MIGHVTQDGLVPGVRTVGPGQVILDSPGPFGSAKGGRRIPGVPLEGTEVVAGDCKLMSVLGYLGVVLNKPLEHLLGLFIRLTGVLQPPGVLMESAEVRTGEGKVALVAGNVGDGPDELFP